MFADHLLPSLVEGLASQGITQPTEIQTRSVPPQVAGKNVLGVAETGSGKTLAYALPLLHRLKSLENNGQPVRSTSSPRGLVLVPARELGEQVSKVFKSLTHTTRVRVRVALGGSKKKIARENVSGMFEILVATPGRLQQLVESGDLTLSDLRTLVIDEADQMIDPGFLPTAQRLMTKAPAGLQVVLFTATLPQALTKTIQGFFPKPPVHIETQGARKLVATLTTRNVNITNGNRVQPLIDVIKEAPDVGTMLFCNTREQLDKVCGWLTGSQIDHVAYRGQMDRTERRNNLLLFRRGEVNVLVTTDLGGRGLDIERVDRVINVHLPTEITNYMHRAGRTARAGQKGTVINLVTQRDQPLLAKLRKRERK